MSSNDSAGKGLGIGSLMLAATIILAALKVGGVIEIGWMGVFLPFAIWFGIALVLSVVLVFTKVFIKKNMTSKQRLGYALLKNAGMEDSEAISTAMKMK